MPHQQLSPQLSWSLAETLFDRIPDTVFFIKDRMGRYRAVNQTLVARCGLREKRELLGRTARAIFPAELADRYSNQDDDVLRGGKTIIDRLEMHWLRRRRIGWCLTTKLPLFAIDGAIIGIVGISRDVGTAGDATVIPQSLVNGITFLADHYHEHLTPAILAKRAGLTPTRFARLVKKLYHLPPSQLITQTRLAAAARLLTDTTLGISEIGLRCGFTDHSAFSRAFRSATGCTPRGFRVGNTHQNI